jgi:hypothetical protein
LRRRADRRLRVLCRLDHLRVADMNPRFPIPPDIGEWLAYDPATGDLHWLRPVSGRRVGDRAGTKGSRCFIIGFRGQGYMAHRVAWFLQTGEQPPEHVDHKDCDPFNNRWSNLRAANGSLNNANQRRRRNHPKGVRQDPSGRYAAEIYANHRTTRLGTFDTEEEAVAAYAAAAARHYGEFARLE